jgi:hypothetical protein
VALIAAFFSSKLSLKIKYLGGFFGACAGLFTGAGARASAVEFLRGVLDKAYRV